MKPVSYLLMGGAILLVATASLAQDEDEADSTPTPGAHAEIVVSADKLPKDPLEVAGSAVVVSGEELRRSGAHTLQDALQDVVGVEANGSSDNGSLLPNLGMWGLKEFDALLIAVDGVPVGGPFNPSLAMVPIDDIDRIEIVKGPQGTLHGMSAFAGMIQVYTKDAAEGGSANVGGGSFSQWQGSTGWSGALGDDAKLRLGISTLSTSGWQDRAPTSFQRLGATLDQSLGKGNLRLAISGVRHQQDWGSPAPYENQDGHGVRAAGFENLDDNFAVKGALQDHDILSVSSLLSLPIRSGLELKNTFGFTRDSQRSVRSFVLGFEGNEAEADGVVLEPKEIVLFDDLRVLRELDMGGKHEMMAGAAITFGRTTGEGYGFEFTFEPGNASSIPDVADLAARDERKFEDQRLFLGFYVRDQWTPSPWLTISAGGRYDRTSEELEAEGGEEETPGADAGRQSKDDGAFSGDASVLARLIDAKDASLSNVNAYVAIKHNFKPAAPNLSEAEEAEILDPETTDSIEGGLKTRWLAQQLRLDVSVFNMDFKNMVVSILGPTDAPKLINAGEQRFRGAEVELRWTPESLKGFSASAGYARHDSKFVEFTFVTPDGELRDVGGKYLELAPKQLMNAKLMYAPKTGLGGFVTLRHQGERFLNRRNTFSVDAFTEFDAGLSYGRGRTRLSVVGRNLGDERAVIGESEIGDGQYYVSAPRRVTAELDFKF